MIGEEQCNLSTTLWMPLLFRSVEGYLRGDPSVPCFRRLFFLLPSSERATARKRERERERVHDRELVLDRPDNIYGPSPDENER